MKLDAEIQALIRHFKFEPLPVEGTLFVSTCGTRKELSGMYPGREKDILNYGLAEGETKMPDGFAD